MDPEVVKNEVKRDFERPLPVNNTVSWENLYLSLTVPFYHPKFKKRRKKKSEK